jgi:hypothetical protein
MNPKEKAIELVYKFYNEIPLLDGCSLCNINYKCQNICENKYKSAKQCALMAVDEILKTQGKKLFWKAVRERIENYEAKDL